MARGACALVVTSVDHPAALPLEHGVKAVVLASRYLVEPCAGGKSRLTHICRVDIRFAISTLDLVCALVNNI